MKIRNGFVSNSSSSSFVFLTTSEAHKKALAKFHPALRQVIEQVVSRVRCFGMDMVTYHEISSHGESNISDMNIEFPRPGTPLDCLVDGIDNPEFAEPLSEAEYDKYYGSVSELLSEYTKTVDKEDRFTHEEDF